MNIRKAIPEDIPQLVELCALHAAYEKAEYQKENKEELLQIGIFSETPILYCWVVENENSLYGYATAIKEYSTWDADYFIHMDCLYLKAETRGEGLGYKLINEVTKFAKQQSCKLIQWHTPPDNELGIQFYDRIGANWKNRRRYYLTLE